MNQFLRGETSFTFPLFVIFILSITQKDIEGVSENTRQNESKASNITEIMVETNASFLDSLPNVDDDVDEDIPYSGLHIPLTAMTKFSIDNDITFIDSNRSGVDSDKIYVVYDTTNRGHEINQKGVGYYGSNESIVFYDDHYNGTADDVIAPKGGQESQAAISFSKDENLFSKSRPKTISKDNQQKSEKKDKSENPKSNVRQRKRKGKKIKSKSETDETKKNIKYKIKKQSSLSTKIRLPSSIVPVHYVLRLHPQFSNDFLVKGSVEIEVEVRESTPRIKLHCKQISVNKTSVKVYLFKTHKSVPIKNIKFNPRRHFMTVKLRRKLRPGRVYVLTVEFSYHLNNEANGFYKALVDGHNGRTSWLAATQFWPSEARRAFPCFDEPGMKATFDVHLARSEKMTSLSNMPLVRSYKTKEDPGWMWDQFATSVNMSTYLLAFAVTDFVFAANDKKSETLIRVWASENMINKTSLVLRVGDLSLSFFEDYFDFPFPLPKMDLIALPKMSFSGMENWGLITFKESFILEDSSLSPLPSSLLIAHEVAHQWFGNLVTFEWWNDLWLNEGFATYMSFLAIDHIEPSWQILDEFVVSRVQEVMALDALSSSHAINSPIKDPSRINDILDSIPYNKGASIIRMMKHFLSEETFRKGLRSYLQYFQYKNTQQDDLWKTLTRAAQQDESLPGGVSIKEIMDTWTLQPGYPLLKVQRFNNGTAILTQERFNLGKRSSKKKKNRKVKWWIPITFTTQRSPSFKHTRAQTWLRQEDEDLRVTGLPPSDRWVIFNIQQTGYYRVNYDVTTWQLLINQLNSNHELIHVTNRAQLVDDSLNLARAGMLPYDLAFKLVSYLRNETEYIPWKAGLRNFKYIKDMLEKTQNFGMFKAFLMDLLDPLVDLIGLEPQENNSMQMQMMRSEVVSWLCQLEHHLCQSKANKVMEELNEFNHTKFDLEYSGSVLCAAVRHGNQEFWEKLWFLYTYSNTPDEKSSYFNALGCTRYIWLLHRYFHLIEDSSSGVRTQEGAMIYIAASQTPVGQYVAWERFRTRWNKMKSLSDFTYNIAPRVIDIIAENLNTAAQLKEILEFREQVRHEHLLQREQSTTSNKVNPILPALNNAVSKVEANLKWMKENAVTITKWLQTRGFGQLPQINVF